MELFFNKDSAYMETLLVFRRMISEKYKDGGWLPACRTLCRELGICDATYTKVIKRLKKESLAKSYPRKGVWITPEKFRIKKIGLVINNGEESPFIHSREMVPVIINKFGINDYYTQIIQGSNPANIARNSMIHCVNGLIWVDPSFNAYEAMDYLYNNCSLPVLSIRTDGSNESSDTIPCIEEDFTRKCQTHIKLFLDRGHKKIAYSGNKWFIDIIGSIFNSSDQDFEIFSYEENSSSKNSLGTMIAENNISALYLDGRGERIESVFRELSDLPDTLQPEVMVRKCVQLKGITSMYPRVKLAAVVDRNPSKFGELAAKKMLDFFETGSLMSSSKIDTFSVREVSDPVNFTFS